MRIYGATIVDFGTWPKVERAYFVLSDIRKSLRAATNADSDSAAVKIAIRRCADELFAENRFRQGDRADGRGVSIDKLGVDANWGPFTDEVYQACREAGYRDKMVPTHGKFYGVTSDRRLEDTKIQPGDRGLIGWRYFRNPANTKRGLPWLLVDSNRWKTFTEKHLRTTPGTPGSVMLNGRMAGSGQTADRYRLLASHYTGERGVVHSALGRTAVHFTKIPDRDVHWWDNLYNCFMIANLVGVREPTAAIIRRPPQRARRNVTYLN